jgi:hypothetical protein
VAVSDTNKIPHALGAAYAYLRAIEPAYVALGKKIQARKAGGTDPIVDNPGELAPMVSNIAFAIELFLKVLRIQDSSKAPRGHELGKLFEGLDESIKVSVRDRYRKHLDSLNSSHEAPYVEIAITGKAGQRSTVPAPELDAALANMGNAFIDWRYMYELEDLKSGVLFFNFFEAMASVRALNDEIRQFKGGAIVKFART